IEKLGNNKFQIIRLLGRDYEDAISEFAGQFRSEFPKTSLKLRNANNISVAEVNAITLTAP
ncbi:3821_t:CDS:1, partial [Acaulospora colombiana]